MPAPAPRGQEYWTEVGELFGEAVEHPIYVKRGRLFTNRAACWPSLEHDRTTLVVEGKIRGLGELVVVRSLMIWDQPEYDLDDDELRPDKVSALVGTHIDFDLARQAIKGVYTTTSQSGYLTKRFADKRGLSVPGDEDYDMLLAELRHGKEQLSV